MTINFSFARSLSQKKGTGNRFFLSGLSGLSGLFV